MQKDHQAAIFEIIRLRIAGQGSLGDVLGEVLSISNDAVYRRYRGDTLLTIYELEKLSKHFGISLDALFSVEEHKVMFDFQPLKHFDFSMDPYLRGLQMAFRSVKVQKNPRLMLTINNTHLLQLLNFPHLVRFKLFFWAKTHIQIKEFKTIKFSYEKINEDSFLLGRDVLQMYNSVPSRELYDPELLRGFAREIQYYFRAQLFEDPTFAVYLLEQLLKFANHLKDQVTIGKKYIYDTQPPADGNDFEVYHNETLNGFGTTYYKTDETEGLYLAHNILNTLHTTDPHYVNDSLQILERQFANASVISQTNEKVRNAYFHSMIRSVEMIKTKLELELEEELL